MPHRGAPPGPPPRRGVPAVRTRWTAATAAPAPPGATAVRSWRCGRSCALHLEQRFHALRGGWRLGDVQGAGDLTTVTDAPAGEAAVVAGQVGADAYAAVGGRDQQRRPRPCKWIENQRGRGGR